MDDSWRDMGPGPELNRFIAERLGWRVEDYNARPDGIKIRTINSWMLLPPGKDAQWWITSYSREGYLTAEQAWQHCLDFTHDANTALPLLEAIRDGRPVNDVALAPGLGGWYVRINRDWLATQIESPALAISFAWLAWSDT